MSIIIRQTETDVLVYNYYFAYLILHNLVAMIFTVSFETIIQRAVGN
jgi:hypothetical protein